jgi:hypothetical protein
VLAYAGTFFLLRKFPERKLLLPKGASRLPVITDRIILVSDRQANRFASDSDVQIKGGQDIF